MGKLAHGPLEFLALLRMEHRHALLKGGVVVADSGEGNIRGEHRHV